MKTTTWMPLYIGDYLSDTIGLTLSQHGAYLMSLMAYWRKGESLTSHELRDICGREINRVSRFFVMVDGRWHHKRVDQELKAARERIRMAAEKSKKMNTARWGGVQA